MYLHGSCRTICCTELLLFLLAISPLLLCTQSAKAPLNVYVIFPYPNEDPLLHPSWYDGPQMFTAASLAAEHINSDPSLLRDYELRLVERDGGCEITTKVAVATAEAITHKSGPVVGMIGPGCSGSSLLATPVLSRQEVALINVHTGGSPLLANSTLYPFGISIYGSTVSFVNTTLALMERANWTRVAVFYEETRPYYSTTYDYLLQRIEQMQNNTVELVVQVGVKDTYLPLHFIEEEKIRIVIVMTGTDLSLRIMCLAQSMGFVTPNYQWIFVGRTFLQFKATSFTYKSEPYSCSDETMRKAMETSLLMNFRLATPSEEEQTVAGITYSVFEDMYNKRLKELGYGAIVWGTLAYDAVWSLALCLNSTVNTINLTEYGPGQFKSSMLIRECFNTLKFNGMSGHVQFDPQTGFQDRAVDIYQVINETTIYSAYYRQKQLRNLTELITIKDSIEVETKEVNISGIAIAFLIATVILLLLIIICHILTVVSRKHPSVKAASPNIVHFTYTGCYMLAIGMLYYTSTVHFDNADHEGNEINNWLCRLSYSFFFPVGLTLIFGSVLVRIWRLYRIFIHSFQPGSMIADDVLIAFIFFMVGIDVVIAVLWVWLDPLQERDEIVSTTFNNVTGKKVEKVFVVCSSDLYSVWFGVIFIYKFIETLPVFLLTLKTHSIRDKEFSTKQAGAYVFIMALIILIMAPSYCISASIKNDEVWLTLKILLFCLLDSVILLLSFLMLFVRPLIPVLVSPWRKLFRAKKLLLQ